MIVQFKSKGRSCPQGTTVFNTLCKMLQTMSIKLTAGNPIQLLKLYYNCSSFTTSHQEWSHPKACKCQTQKERNNSSSGQEEFPEVQSSCKR